MPIEPPSSCTTTLAATIECAAVGTNRTFPGRLPPLHYPSLRVKRVTNAGTIRFKHKLLALSRRPTHEHRVDRCTGKPDTIRPRLRQVRRTATASLLHRTAGRASGSATAPPRRYMNSIQERCDRCTSKLTLSGTPAPTTNPTHRVFVSPAIRSYADSHARSSLS